MTTPGVSYNLSGAIRHLGLPVAGVAVLLFEHWRLSTGVVRQFLGRQRTGPRGEFNFDVRAGSYGLEVIPDSSTRFIRHTVDDIRVTGNHNLNVSLSTGALLSGKVLDDRGEVVRDCRVVALAIEPVAYRASDRPGADGQYSLVLPKGRYCLAVRHDTPEEGAPEKGTDNRPEVPFICNDVSVLDLESDTRHDLVLPDMVRLRGKAMDQSGAPVAGALVSATPVISEDNVILVDLRMRTTCVSDAAGSYEMLVQPGSYDMLLVPPEGAALAETREKAVSITASTQRDFTLPPGHRLRGKVEYEGHPVRGCLIKLHGPDGRAAVASTSADGKFSIGVAAGEFELSVSGSPDAVGRAANTTIAPWLRQLKVEADTEITVDLGEGISVFGQVLDSAQNARPGVRVSAVPLGGGPFNEDDAGRPIASGITADDGSYCFALMPGRYWVYVNDDSSTVRELEIVAEPARIDFTWTAGHVVRFEVQGENDEPIARCKIVFEPYAHLEAHPRGRQSEKKPASVTGFSQTGDGGTCQITLPAGIYSFKFMPPAQGSYQSKTIRQLSVGTDMHRKVKLSVRKAPTESREEQAAGQLTLNLIED